MKRAKTLLELAGAKPIPAKLEDATLIVIDAQNEYFGGKLPLDEIGHAVARLNDLAPKPILAQRA